MARGSYLTQEERNAIQAAYEAGEDYKAVANRLNRAPSTICNAYTRARNHRLLQPYTKTKGGVAPDRRAGPWIPGTPKPGAEE